MYIVTISCGGIYIECIAELNIADYNLLMDAFSIRKIISSEGSCPCSNGCAVCVLEPSYIRTIDETHYTTPINERLINQFIDFIRHSTSCSINLIYMNAQAPEMHSIDQQEQLDKDAGIVWEPSECK
jgi:hypothetical protein